jgi:hypothetical protein
MPSKPSRRLWDCDIDLESRSADLVVHFAVKVTTPTDPLPAWHQPMLPDDHGSRSAFFNALVWLRNSQRLPEAIDELNSGMMLDLCHRIRESDTSR